MTSPADLPATPVVILDQPQLAENIGAAARVMANFGLDRLRLVAPRDGWPQDRAYASASGADWVVDGVEVFPTVAAAIADLNLVHASTARPRETQLPVLTARTSATALHAEIAAGGRAGILFGAERAGLESMDIALCHAIVTLPVDDRFRSLNLAQAVAINAYEWRLSVDDRPPARFRDTPPPAEQDAVLGMFEHLEAELEHAGFFHPPEKKPAMIRNLRVALGRARFSHQEVKTFRGVVTALVRGRGRTRARLAAKMSERDQG